MFAQRQGARRVQTGRRAPGDRNYCHVIEKIINKPCAARSYLFVTRFLDEFVICLDRFAGIEFSFMEGFSKSSHFLSRPRHFVADATTARRVLSRGKYGRYRNGGKCRNCDCYCQKSSHVSPLLRN